MPLYLYMGVWGFTDGSAAVAGYVGEQITASAAASAVALTTATTANMTSISLTAGDWDVRGVVYFAPAATTSVTVWQGGISTTSATLGAAANNFNFSQPAEVPTALTLQFPTPTVRISLSATTTVFLVAQSTFTLSTQTGGGSIVARRRR